MNGRPTHFDIQISEPWQHEHNGEMHVSLHHMTLDVITTDVRRAIELTMERHPRATVHVVQQRGMTNLLFDPRIAKEVVEDE